jgi:hypothetical protein
LVFSFCGKAQPGLFDQGKVDSILNKVISLNKELEENEVKPGRRRGRRGGRRAKGKGSDEVRARRAMERREG